MIPCLVEEFSPAADILSVLSKFVPLQPARGPAARILEWVRTVSASSSKIPATYTVRSAVESDMEQIYAVAREALHLDRFSPNLLREKLLANRRAEEFRWFVDVATFGERIVGFLQSAFRPSVTKGWIGLFGVTADHRRRGVGQSLHAAAIARMSDAIREIEALAIPCNYLVPGVDPRYTESLCFLEALGYRRFAECSNMKADLSQEFATGPAIAELSEQGVTIRRADPADRPILDAFFAAHFGEGWRYEAELAFENASPSLHLALREDRIIAFSAHSTQNREWGFFGPMGTAPECRGLGVGRVLLWLCLNDLREAGHASAVIPWVGPISFYHRWAGCRVQRVFWRYRLDRSASAPPQ